MTTIVILKLLEGGAQVNLQDNFGRSPLMIASECGILKNVNTLLEHGAEVDLQDEEGRSALMRYVYQLKAFDDGIFIRLLRGGASVNLQDTKGRSALMLACKNRLLPTIDPLLSNSLNIEVDFQDKKDGLL